MVRPLHSIPHVPSEQTDAAHCTAPKKSRMDFRCYFRHGDRNNLLAVHSVAAVQVLMIRVS